ncbi:MAG: hypothetical protein JSV02_10290, partial [Dehalococcoidia bacterium]
MPKSKSGSSRVKAGAPSNFISRQWRLLKLVVIAAVLAAIAIFYKPVLETIGFSLVFWLLWAVLLILIVWMRKIRILLSRWNIVLGAFILTFAIWGVLALLHPPKLIISEVNFSEVSLGGDAGKYLIGNQDVGLVPAVRLTLLILGVLILILPRSSLQFLRLSIYTVRTAGAEVFTRVSLFVASSGRQLAHLIRNHPPHRLFAVPVFLFVHIVRRRRAAESGMPAGALISESPIDRTKPGARLAEEKPTSRQTRFVIEDTVGHPTTPAEPPHRPNGKDRGPLPPIDLLDKVVDTDFTEADNEQRARLIEKALDSYGVDAKVV